MSRYSDSSDPPSMSTSSLWPRSPRSFFFEMSRWLRKSSRRRTTPSFGGTRIVSRPATVPSSRPNLHSPTPTSCQIRGARLRRAGEVGPVRREVLRDETDLLLARHGERACLAQDRLGVAAALRAAQLRDDAEGARAIAALRDLDVGRVRRHRR